MMKNVIILIFLIAGLNNAWPISPEVLQNVQKSVFLIKRNGVEVGTGFVVEEDTLVTNFHVYDSLDSLNSISIQNTDNQVFRIEGVREASLYTDLALLKIENYNGPSLVLGDLPGKGESTDFYLVGFPKNEFGIIDLVKGNDIDIFHQFFGIFNGILINGASGSPIVNSKGEVVSVASSASFDSCIGIKKGTLQVVLDETRNRTFAYNGIIRDSVKQREEDIRNLANQGYVEAQYIIGKRYLDVENLKEAVHWFAQAANGGHAEAQYSLGWMAFQMEDFDRAIEWFTLAANQGHADAQSSLGRMALQEEHFDRAIDWFTLAANQGHADAQYGLAQAFHHIGRYSNAVQWLTHLASRGHILAQEQLDNRMSSQQRDGTE